MIFLEIFTLLSLSIVVGLTWLNNRISEVAAKKHDGACIPRWMIDLCSVFAESTPESLLRRKPWRGWRWLLLGLYVSVLLMILDNSQERLPIRLALESASLVILGIWLYVIENQLRKIAE
jgi:hypothetical protein